MTDWEPRSWNPDMCETYLEGILHSEDLFCSFGSFLTCSHFSQKIPHFDTDSALIGVFLVKLETSDKNINISMIKLTLKYVFFPQKITFCKLFLIEDKYMRIV